MSFANPPAEFRIMPFWFWNGDMEESQLRHQIEEMATKGLGGFFICPRQGLGIPYLSQEWFDRVRFAVEVAKQHGLQVWLYDEYPYPSGIAGGEVVLRHPEAKHRVLRYRAVDVTGPQPVSLELPWARVLSAQAVPYDPKSEGWLWGSAVDLSKCVGNQQTETVFQKTGLTAYNQSRYFTYGPEKVLRWDAPQGIWKVLVFVEEEISDFKYYGTYVDPCNEEAVESFIRLTHERYAETIGDHFGDTVQGLFTDEVGLLGNPPWSPRLPEVFLREHGYSLVDQLPQLYYGAGEQTAKLRYDYFDTVHLLLRETYHRRIGEWCERHGLRYVTEVPSLRMTNQMYSHVPAGDSAHEKLGRSLDWILRKYTGEFRSNPKMVSSLARQLGRERALIECFHSVGWSMTLQDAKWMIDRMLALGINFFNFHAFFFTIDGLTKHDAPPSQFLQNPYWPYFRQLTDYAGRASYLMSQGKASIRVAVLDPVTTFWTHMGNTMHGARYCGEDSAEEKRLVDIREDWIYICNSLLTSQIEYDHLDPEMLAAANVSGGRIRIGHASYSVLVVPPITNLETAAWEKIKAFSSEGGTVIGLGLLPYETIEEGQRIEDEALEWFGVSAPPRDAYFSTLGEKQVDNQWVRGERGTYFLTCEGSLRAARAGDDLLALLGQISPSPVRLETISGDGRACLMHHRTLPDESQLVFITHQEDGEVDTRLSVERGDRHLSFERLYLESGTSQPIEAEPAGSQYLIPLTLGPYQSALVRFEYTSVEAGTEATPSEHFLVEIDTAQEWRVSSERPNLVRFGTFGFRLDVEDIGLRESWQTGDAGSDWPEVEAKTLIDQCADASQLLGPPLRFGQVFGTPMRIELSYPLACWYRTSFTVRDVPSDCRLLMEKAAISGEFEIFLNGHRLPSGGFQPVFRYDQHNRECDVCSLIVTGRNHLMIRVLANHDWDGLVSPLYLAGSFGVGFDPEARPVLTNAPEFGSLHCGVHEGYPYYSGTLVFRSKLEVSEIPASEFELSFNNWDPRFHDCAEVLINGQSLGVRAWTPYRWRGDSDILRLGENAVEVRVTNTLISTLEGKYFDYTRHELVDVKILRAEETLQL